MALLLCTHWGPEHPALLAHGRTKAILIFTFRKLFSLAFRDVLFLFGFDKQVKQHVEFPGPCCSLDDKHVKSSMKTGYYCFRTSKHCMLSPCYINRAPLLSAYIQISTTNLLSSKISFAAELLCEVQHFCNSNNNTNTFHPVGVPDCNSLHSFTKNIHNDKFRVRLWCILHKLIC